jgi:hypothetical protein
MNTRPRVTIWSSDGATKAYDDKRTRALLDAARPPVITLHTGPLALAARGDKLTERVRRDYPGAAVWWAVTGDAHGPDPTVPWSLCAQVAEELRVPVLEFNCESAWRKQSRPFGVARAALLAAKARAPSVEFGHTAFDGPVNFPYRTLGPIKLRWGYGESYDWRGFLGAGSPVQWSAPQVYAAGKLTRGTRARLLDRFDKHTRSWAIAVRNGLVRPDVRRDIYLQSHSSDTSGLVTLAETALTAAFWATPHRLDADGARAIRVLCELHRRGQSLREFQTSAGLAADRIAGPLTCAALGVS